MKKYVKIKIFVELYCHQKRIIYNILELNQYMKSDKMSYIIYVDTESLIKKTGGCGNNPENSSIRKIGEHIPCLYSISTI